MDTEMTRLMFLILGTMACSTRVHTGGMTSTPIGAPDDALQLSVHESLVIVGVAGKGLVGPDQGMAALGIEGVLPPAVAGDEGQPFSPHFALGVHALQWDWSDGVRTFGAGSPYAQMGGHVCKDRGSPLVTCIGLSLDASYHLRFGAEDQLWMGASLVLSRFDDFSPGTSSTKRKGGKKGRKKKKKKKKNRRR
jgi:hypothetical protein